MRFAFLFPRFKMLSGAERLILKLAGALIEKGHKISIHCHQFDETCRSILPVDAEVEITGINLNPFKNRYANAAFDYLRSNVLAKELPKGLDAVCCFGPALAASKTARKAAGAPILYFCYEPPRFLYTDRETIRTRLGVAGRLAGPVFSVYKRIDRKRVHHVDCVLSNSEFGKKRIHEIYGRDSFVITHGLDPFRESLRRDELRNRYGFQPNDIVVITVNYLHPRKRIPLFLDIVRAVRLKNPAVRGFVVGDGPERDHLMEGAKDEAVFAGFVPEPELADYYQAADLYLHTARLETFGLSAIEAAANELPLVSVNEGGPIETVHDGRTGFLRETSGLVDAVFQLSNDAELRKEFGKNGAEAVRKKYRWEQGAEDFLAAVRSVS